MTRFYAQKKDNESSEKLVSRFKKLFFGSRMLNHLRDNRYNYKKPSKRQLREKAIVCSAYRDLNEELF